MVIDDFGTGFSSLSYLRRFPIDALKIDRSFVAKITAAGRNSAVVTAVIEMAHSKLRVVAEGVETLEQLEFLLAHDCYEARGYYFSRPLAPPAFQTFLRAGEERLRNRPGCLNSQHNQAKIAYMKRISITAAKNGLSALIERVRQGDSVIIEDRGVPVARLESVAVAVAALGRDVEGRAARLLRQGVLQPSLAAVPKRLLTTSPPRPTGGATASGALIDERRDGR